MFEIALHFEQMATQLRPIILISVGLACVIIGLFLWLGGLGFRKVLVIVVGAVSGGVCGFFITDHNIVSAGILAALAVFIAILFEKIFITILAAALAAVVAFAVLAGPYIQNQADFSTKIKQACLQMPAYSWVIIAVLLVIFIMAGIFLWRLTSALCCAALGTMLIFAGMILLLLYKGAVPISYICSRTLFYTVVLVAMMAFGTIEQLLLSKPAKRQSIAKKETSKGKQEPDKKLPSWRTN